MFVHCPLLSAPHAHRDCERSSQVVFCGRTPRQQHATRGGIDDLRERDAPALPTVTVAVVRKQVVAANVETGVCVVATVVLVLGIAVGGDVLWDFRPDTGRQRTTCDMRNTDRR